MGNTPNKEIDHTIEFFLLSTGEAVAKFVKFFLALAFFITVYLVIIATLGDSIRVKALVDGCTSRLDRCWPNFVALMELSFVEVRYFLKI